MAGVFCSYVAANTLSATGAECCAGTYPHTFVQGIQVSSANHVGKSYWHF